MFRSVIMKLTAFCNLNCTYCYMFNQADLTYLRVPKHLPLDTALICLDRIQEHLTRHNQKQFHIALHGGEPTLWLIGNYQQFLSRIEMINTAGFDLRVTIQTNAMAISDNLLELFARHNVHMGVSVDGPQKYNDKMRISHAGSGSYDRVMRTVETVIKKGHGNLLNGFLCVAPVDVSPEVFLNWIDQLPIRDVDVLWPMEFNHDNTPWGDQSCNEYTALPRIGCWFADLFLAWWQRDDPTLKIRLFEDCIGQLIGSQKHVDNIVNDAISSFVLNTDGCIEYHDYFRSHADGACRTHFNINSDTLDALLIDPGFEFCLNLRRYLPMDCVGCTHEKLCGGGFLPGRFEKGHSLPVRRSVLCFDQFYLFTTIRNVVTPYIETSRL